MLTSPLRAYRISGGTLRTAYDASESIPLPHSRTLAQARTSSRAAADIVQTKVVAASASGRCLCGEVRFEVLGPLGDLLICHCRECRRWSGHLFAATAARRQDLVVEGPTLTWVESPESETGARRGFCSSCGSSLFWDAPD